MPFDNRACIIAADDHLNEISSAVNATCVHSAKVKVSTHACDEVVRTREAEAGVFIRLQMYVHTLCV